MVQNKSSWVRGESTFLISYFKRYFRSWKVSSSSSIRRYFLTSKTNSDIILSCISKDNIISGVHKWLWLILGLETISTWKLRNQILQISVYWLFSSLHAVVELIHGCILLSCLIGCVSASVCLNQFCIWWSCLCSVEFQTLYWSLYVSFKIHCKYFILPTFVLAVFLCSTGVKLRYQTKIQRARLIKLSISVEVCFLGWSCESWNTEL